MKKTKIFVLLTLAPCLLFAQTPHGWRGAERNGFYNETGLLKSWPENGPELLWVVEDLGSGYSSPVIVNNRLYVTGMNADETMETFSAYSLDGKRIYTVEYSKPWDKTYPETRTTPAIQNGKAYVISGSGEIVCINIADGKIVWKVDGGKVFERSTGNWGTSECPLVFDNKVIYTPSGNQTTMVALNAQTGELIWKTKSLGEVGCYVSPKLITHKGKRQIIGSTSVNLFGVNPDNGDIEWTFSDWGTPPRPYPEGMSQGSAMWVNIATNTPFYHDGRIFFGHGYNIGGFMLQLNDDLTGVSLLWKTNDLCPHHGGYVLVDGILYGSNYTNNASGNWAAVDWETGETKYNESWQARAKGSIIAADGMLYLYEERRGTVGLVRATPEKFDVVSEFRITKGTGPHWAHPVINNGVLYIRHGTALMAYKIN